MLSISLSITVWVYAGLMGVDYCTVDGLTGSVYAAVVSIFLSTQSPPLEENGLI